MQGIAITSGSLIVLLVLAAITAAVGFFYMRRKRGARITGEGRKPFFSLRRGKKGQGKDIPWWFKPVLLFDLDKGDYGITYLDVNLELENAGWRGDDTKNLRQWVYKNLLVYTLIKDGKEYLPVNMPKTLKQPPERVYRHLECKEASVCFAIPLSTLGKVNIGLFILFGIVALFIVYLMMAGG